jgi:hypothetical protein
VDYYSNYKNAFNENEVWLDEIFTHDLTQVVSVDKARNHRCQPISHLAPLPVVVILELGCIT